MSFIPESRSDASHRIHFLPRPVRAVRDPLAADRSRCGMAIASSSLATASRIRRRYTSFVEKPTSSRDSQAGRPLRALRMGRRPRLGGGGGPMDVRLWRDVLPYNPTVVTIMLGMNDAAIGPSTSRSSTPRERIQAYRGCAEAPASGDSHHCIQPSAYDDVTRAPGFGRRLQPGTDPLWRVSVGLASERMLDVADLEYADREHAHQGECRRSCAPPADPGQGSSERANRSGDGAGTAQILEAPAVVTEVEIDAARHTAATQINTRVSDIKSEKGVGWTQMDEAAADALNRQDPLGLWF